MVISDLHGNFPSGHLRGGDLHGKITEFKVKNSSKVWHNQLNLMSENFFGKDEESFSLISKRHFAVITMAPEVWKSHQMIIPKYTWPVRVSKIFKLSKIWMRKWKVRRSFTVMSTAPEGKIKIDFRSVQNVGWIFE